MPSRNEVRIGFAFKTDAPGFYSWVIRFLTKSQDRISHVEYIHHDGLSFSSRESGLWDNEKPGSQWRRIDYNDGKSSWLICYANVPIERTYKVEQLIREMEGLPYDKLGIIRWYFNISKNNKKQFCSECCDRIAREYGFVTHMDANLTSPQRLFDGLVSDPKIELDASRAGGRF